MGNKAVVELQGVTFAYHREPVLKDINLRVEAGEFFAIIGANGAAKTTLMKVMLGLLRPQGGRVFLLGEDIRSFKSWKEIGYVSQMASHINPAFPATVEEVVASGYYTGFGKLFSPGRASAVKGALERTGLSKLHRRRIGELSGGQRQRVFLARALVQNPKVLFLDEPTTGIDPPARREFYSLLDELHRQGTTIIMVTHDLACLGEGKSLCEVRNRKAEIITGPIDHVGGEDL